MKCPKPRFAYRPFVETLESRLQPGSIFTTQAYGWSLLAGYLSILNRDSWDGPSLLPQAAVESSRPAPASTPVPAHSDNFAIAVASVAAARSETAGLPPSNLVDNLAAGLASDDLSNLSLRGRRNSVALAAISTPMVQQSPPATPFGSVPQSPIGVTTPAAMAASPRQNAPASVSPTGPAGSASGHQAVPVQMSSLGSGTVQELAGYQTTNDVQAHPIALAKDSSALGGGAANQATVNFLSYLGRSGPDSMNYVVVRNEAGANFLYVAGSFTDTDGRTDAFVAKLADGATSVVWSMALTPATPGPDRAFGLALNGNNVYLAGSVSDPAVASQSDGFVAQLDATNGQVITVGTIANASLAAVTTDAAGNVYAAGWVPDPMHADQKDIAFLKVSGDLSTTFYVAWVKLKFLNAKEANSSVTTGGGLIVDGQGNLFVAGSVSKAGDPINDTAPLYVWLVEVSGQPHYGTAVTAPNPVPGPNGAGTAVSFDPKGNVVFTGTFNDDGSGDITHGSPTILNQDMLLGRVTPTITPNPNPNRPPVYDFKVLDSYRYYVDDRTADHNRVGDWTGNGLVVLSDGSAIVTGAVYDPAAPNNPPLSMPTNGLDVHMTHFLPTDAGTPSSALIDADPENIFGGSGTDIGNAMALDPTNPTNVYVVGSTTSIDLPTTPGVVQPTYAGGSTTGFVGQASVT